MLKVGGNQVSTRPLVSKHKIMDNSISEVVALKTTKATTHAQQTASHVRQHQVVATEPVKLGSVGFCPFSPMNM